MGRSAAARTRSNNVTGPPPRDAKTIVRKCGIGEVDLRVAIIDSDRYALNAINAYLAWDRRTRVVLKTDSLKELAAKIAEWTEFEYPHVVILDANYVDGVGGLFSAISELRRSIPGLMVICLAQIADLNTIHEAIHGGARAFFLKDDVRLHIGWASYFTAIVEKRCFFISGGLVDACKKLSHERLRFTKLLPGPRMYPGLTPRLREAIILYAIEGMRPRLIAHEMGISEITVRDYIKKAYRVLESAADDCDYPADMSQQEVAFMRLTALEAIALECD